MRIEGNEEAIGAVRGIKKDIPAEYGVLIQKFRLIDDTFFNVCFDNLMMGRIFSTSTVRTAMIRRSGRAVNVDRSSASFGFDLRDVFAYDLLTNQLRALHLLLG